MTPQAIQIVQEAHKAHQDYPLTLTNVKCYLATKQNDEILGECGNMSYCLLTETLKWLYPGHRWYVGNDEYWLPNGPVFRLDPDLKFLRLCFDAIPLTTRPQVTKARFREYLFHEITESQYVPPLPFTVSDLFGAEGNG